MWKRLIQGMAFSLLILSVGCDSDAEVFLDKDTSSPTHAQMMGLKGAVKTVQVYCPEEELYLLEAAFDSRGRCLRWNDTGVPMETTAVAQRGITSGWLSASASYVYSYDGDGRLVGIDQHLLGGEVAHYSLSYGPHTLPVPLPFPFGGLSDYFIEGVTEIQSDNFHLTCDGLTTVSERKTLAWMALTEQTECLYEDGKLLEQTLRLWGQRGASEPQQLERVRTFYTYQGGHLSKTLAVAVDADLYQEKVETVYGTVHPGLPVRKSFYTGTSLEPLSETVYEYDTAGRILRVDNPVGEAYFETPYQQEYLTFDAVGNWKTAVRHMEGYELNLQQTVTYW